MRIENSFTVDAPPDRVFGYLLDVNEVVTCIPGAELSEVVDSQTFRGRLKVKVGPVQVTYQGTAHIEDISEGESSTTVTVAGEGRETTGQGTVRGRLQLTVAGTPDDGSTTVGLASDVTLAGRLAQFGQGMIEDVSRKLVDQMSECIRSRLRAATR